MDYIEVTANFVIPTGTSRVFVSMLERAMAESVFPRIVTQEFYYYGIWVDEWLLDPPTSKDAVAFSLGISKGEVVAIVRDDVIVETEGGSHVRSAQLRAIPFSQEEIEKSPRKKNVEMGEEIERTLRDKLFQHISFRQWLKKFSREKFSPSVDLKSSDVRSTDLGSVNPGSHGNYEVRESSHVRSSPLVPYLPPTSRGITTSDEIELQEAYIKGYADGFEAGGGDVVDATAKMRETDEKFSREKSDENIKVIASGEINPDDDSSEADNPR